MLSMEQAIASVSFMVAMTILAYKVRIIDKYGAIVALPVGFITLYFGSILWFSILLIFFITGSLFTKYKYRQKQSMELAEDNSGARSWKSVVANGAPAAAFAILYYLSHNNPTFTLFFIGSISFALSDTMATEIGLLSKSKPYSIVTGKKIDTGQSGGITIQGEIAALIGSLFIGSICESFLSDGAFSQMHVILLAAITGGMIATNIDSILGATIQAKYKCLNCKKYVEKMTIHCNLPVVQERGISMVDNNVVNLLAAFIGGLISASFIILR
jgi:uncharacterized protein (TIGR00297 family)